MSMKYPYRDLGVPFDRNFRNDLNANFDDIEHDILMIGGEAAQQALEAAHEAETQAIYAQQMGDYAEGKGDYAAQQGDYAKTQGDYAKVQGDAANLAAINVNDATNNANSAAANANNAAANANNAADNANTAADNANDAATNANTAADNANTQATNAQNAAQSANDAATNANNAANNANTQATYAQTQGDYARQQGDYALAKGDYANEKAILADQAATNANAEANNLSQLKADATIATQNANNAAAMANDAANNATNQANYAKSQGDYAKEQGDYAKSQGDYAHTQGLLIDNLKTLGEYDLSVTYEKNNIVRYNGSSYIAKQTTVGNPPTDTTYWELLAQRGVDGQGSISSVNNIHPDINGNITLTATDVGASPSNHTHPELHTHDNKTVLEGLSDNAGQLLYNGTPVGSVASVNGQTGDVILTATDVGAETPTGAQAKADQAEANAKTYADQKVSEHSAETASKFTNINLNIIDMAVELETLKGATLNGVTANIFVETFTNLNDINLMNGIYDSVNKRLVL